VLELIDQGWSVQKIGEHFSRRGTVVAKILHRAQLRKARAERKEREVEFRAACRRREGSVEELALRFKVSRWTGYRIAHALFGAAKFRGGPSAPQHLPMTTAAAPPEQPLAEPDSYVAALVGYFNRFHDGKLTPPERDGEILVKFLRFLPPDVPDFVRDDMAFNLVRGLDCLRKQSAGAWLH
jgi:hypothetical protein